MLKAPKEGVKQLPLEKVRLDGGTQSRAELNAKAVSEYAKLIEEKVRLDEVDVFFDGSHYWLAHGFHRLYAHIQAKQKFISVRVHIGTVRDAILFSVGQNAEHGVQRSTEDKHHAVNLLLNDPEWSLWSAARIAAQCKVSESLVSEIRKNRRIREEARRRKEKEEALAAAEAAKRPKQPAERLTLRTQTEESNGRVKYQTKHGTISTMSPSRKGHPVPLPPPEEDLDEEDRAVIRDKAARTVRKLCRFAAKLGEDAHDLVDEFRPKKQAE